MILYGCLVGFVFFVVCLGYLDSFKLGCFLVMSFKIFLYILDKIFLLGVFFEIKIFLFSV